MPVFLKVDYIYYYIGYGELLNSFFSTVAFHLEKKNGWGSRFPCVMRNLYEGELNFSDIPEATKEIEIIKNELRSIPPDLVIWDLDDINVKPPWGTNISANIQNLSEYFITNDGRNLLTLIELAFDDALYLKKNIKIISKE